MMVSFTSFILVAEGASGPGGAPASPFSAFGPIILMMVIMYLLLIRPQSKKAKEHREMVNRLKKGDSVVTGGGIHGVITSVEENAVELEVAEDVRITVLRSSVGNILNPDE